MEWSLPQEGTNPADPFILDYWPPKLSENNLVKPSNLWHFVAAALGNRYTGSTLCC